MKKKSKMKVFREIENDMGANAALSISVATDDDGDPIMAYGTTVVGHPIQSFVTTHDAGFHITSTVGDFTIPEECVDDLGLMLLSLNGRFLRGQFNIRENMLIFESFVTCHKGSRIKAVDLVKEMRITLAMIQMHFHEIEEKVESIIGMDNTEYVIVEGQ